jgi:hypothetical protein
MGVELGIRSQNPPFRGCNLPASMDKDSFGAHERYGVGERTHDVYLELESRVCAGGGGRLRKRGWVERYSSAKTLRS